MHGTDVLANAILQFLERLNTARERKEYVVKHEAFYETDLGSDVRNFIRLCLIQNVVWNLIKTSRNSSFVTLEQIIDFDDAGLAEYDVSLVESVRFAPGVAWAHARVSEQHHVAVLPLPLHGVPSGEVSVEVAGFIKKIIFVTDEAQHVNFFRSVIKLENADESKFKHLAQSAFPALEWADNVWSGLRDFSRPYINIRDELIHYLAGLNDHGAKCFYKRSNNPSELSKYVGTETSDENGATKKFQPSKRDRTRIHCGIKKVFWWHVKLRRHAYRIYFLYESRSIHQPSPEYGRIVIGIFKDHCILPN